MYYILAAETVSEQYVLFLKSCISNHPLRSQHSVMLMLHKYHKVRGLSSCRG